MAGKKGKKRRSKHYFSKLKRRASKARPPFEMLLTGIAIPFVPSINGGKSPIEHFQNGNAKDAMVTLVQGFTGFNIYDPQNYNVFSALNPFDFNSARYTKMLLIGGLIGMVRKRLVKQSTPLIRKIPLIGRWVS